MDFEILKSFIMPNTSATPLDSVYTPPDHFNVYANAFDLSLLPTIEIPSTSTDDYIPTTVYQHDFSAAPIKAESIQPSPAYYENPAFTVTPPSMLSPAQSEHFFSGLPPSPTPSHASSSSSFSSSSSSAGPVASIKQEYCGSLYPPSPPDSYGSLSPRCPADYQLVKGEHLSTAPHNPNHHHHHHHHHHHFHQQAAVGDIGGAETTIDIDLLLANSIATASSDSTSADPQHTTVFGQPQQQQQDHALLREFLQDTTFQRRHNLKPLALDALLMVGGWANGDDIGPVISLALEHARKDVQRTCEHLRISPDPQQWSHEHVQSWLQSTSRQFGLSVVHDHLRHLFPEDGAGLALLSDEEFVKRLPQNGGTLHAQLEVWKAACSECIATNSPATCFGMMDMMGGQGQVTMSPIDNGANGQRTDDTTNEQATANPWSPMATTGTADAELMGANNGPVDDFSDDEDDEMSLPALAGISTDALDTPQTSTASAASANVEANAKAPSVPAVGGPKARQGSAHIHLWQFLKELLADSQQHGTAIRWLDRTKGVFKIEDSVRVARLWGRRKNRPAMNYDKLSRSIRQYYKKGIMKKTERSQRLVYQFCHPYSL